MRDIFLTIAAYAAALALLILLAGCKTATTTTETATSEERASVRTEYVDRWRTDSVAVYDSVYIKQAADTVWEYRLRTIYRDRLLRDTIAQTTRDTVVVERSVATTKTTEKSGWREALKTKLLPLLFTILLIVPALKAISTFPWKWLFKLEDLLKKLFKR